jgi:hypothetical protein
MWLRRSLLAALVVFAGLAVALARDDKKDDKKDDAKKDDKDKPKATLAWKLEDDKGKPVPVFYQKMTTDTTQKMKVSNQEVTQTQKQTFIFSYTPEKKDGDTWTIKQKIEGVDMTIDIGGTTIKYNSTDKAADQATNPLSEFFKALVGSEFTLTVKAEKGKEATVTEIKGRTEFLQKLGLANPQMQPLLNQILSDKALIEMAQPTFAALPGKEVAKGETWSRNSKLDMGPIGVYENAYEYTYDGKDNKLDVIKVKTTLKYKEPAAGEGVGGLPFKIKKATLDSEPATGTIKYDPEKGRIESSSMELKLKGTLEIEIGGQTTKVDLDQTQKTTVENMDKNPLPTK